MNFNNPIILDITQEECLRIKDKMLGIPYKLHGRNFNGVDCWGCIILFYKLAFNYTIKDFQSYNEDTIYQIDYLTQYRKSYFNEWEEVKQPALGDVVLFSLDKKTINHAGILIAPNKFLHACSAGVVVSEIGQREWTKNQMRTFRTRSRNVSANIQLGAS